MNFDFRIPVNEETALWDIEEKSKEGDKFFAQIHEESTPMLIDIGIEERFAAYTQKAVYNEINHGDNILLVVRANHMKIRSGKRLDDKKNALVGKILRRKFMGVFYRFEVLVEVNGREKVIIVSIPATYEIHNSFTEDTEVTVYFPKELGIVFKHPGDEVIKEVLKLE